MKIFSKALEKGDRLMTLQAGLVHGRIGRRAFIQMAVAAGASLATAKVWAQELGDAAITQRYNAQNLARSHDYIVAGFQHQYVGIGFGCQSSSDHSAA